MSKKTKIICTIGPASESKEVLTKLVEAGMNIARLNFSHGDYEEHAERIKRIREVSKETGKPIGILLDTKGPEIRLGDFENGGCEFDEGDEIDLVKEEVLGNHERFTLRCPEVFNDVKVGDYILMDDGKMKVIFTEVTPDRIHGVVSNPHFLKSRKGCNLPGIKLSMPFISEKDESDIRFGCKMDVDYIAASFTRRKDDVLAIRQILIDENKDMIQIFPKIENQEGFDNIREILEVADGVMVARGDLGVDVSLELVPIYQKRMIAAANEVGKPAITATHMLESMQENPRPTRAEASDVANAILDGTDAIMLSGETAAGLYPVESVQTMHKIASRIEDTLNHKEIVRARSKQNGATMTEAIAQSVAYTSLNLQVSAILAPTESGATARAIAKYRPGVPVVAVTSSDVTSRQLTLVWGVQPLTAPKVTSTDEVLELAVQKALESDVVKYGDLVVITAGVPVGEAGTTNLMKVHMIGDKLTKGQGIGRAATNGKALVVKNAAEALAEDATGRIIVTIGSDREMMPAVEKCAGLITEEGGLTSHAAVVGLSLGIPVIVGVKNATTVIEQGQEISMDATSGVIYKGYSSIL